MATAQQGNAATTAVPQRTNDKTRKFDLVKHGLDERLGLIEDVLPVPMKGQGRRLIGRAILTLARKPELAEVPVADFVRLVIEAAEMGMAIDGRLGYVVRYKSQWQFQADYKGLIATARQRGIIKDAYARIVCENDQFHYGERDGTDYLDWEPAVTDRGAVIGAFAKVTLPDGTARYEYMDLADLERIRERAPAKNGPWRTDTNEMYRKTVLRRSLKGYLDEPAFVPEAEEDPPALEVERPVGPQPRWTPVSEADSQFRYPAAEAGLTEEQLDRAQDSIREHGWDEAELGVIMQERFRTELLSRIATSRFEELMRLIEGKDDGGAADG